MSLELHLGFDMHDLASEPPLCYQRLKLRHRAELIEDEVKAVAVPLPEGAYWYEDDGVKLRAADCYGKPLTWIPAITLAHRLERLELGAWDLALLAYLKGIPPGTKVVLWWS